MWNFSPCGFWEMFMFFFLWENKNPSQKGSLKILLNLEIGSQGVCPRLDIQGTPKLKFGKHPKMIRKTNTVFHTSVWIPGCLRRFFQVFWTSPIGPQNRAPFCCFWALWQMMDDDGSWWWMCLFCLSVRRLLPMMRPTPDVENLYVPTIPVFGF